jgi:hypothetical protein
MTEVEWLTPMTEVKWLTSTDPETMLKFLNGYAIASNRKFRLFACHCCYRVWPTVAEGRGKMTIELAEAFGENIATHGELSQAYREAREGSTEEMKHISNRNSILDKPKRMTWFCQV